MIPLQDDLIDFIQVSRDSSGSKVLSVPTRGPQAPYADRTSEGGGGGGSDGDRSASEGQGHHCLLFEMEDASSAWIGQVIGRAINWTVQTDKQALGCLLL